MSYKVVNKFNDSQDNNLLYEIDDGYPKGKHKPTKKRIEELSMVHPKYKVVFIEEIEKKKE